MFVYRGTTEVVTTPIRINGFVQLFELINVVTFTINIEQDIVG
ncbi:hypothetical protein OGZ01_31725 (plasmid) [Vibrio harveyi]|nr:hypothetical protein [Vibrio harveyi]